MKKPFINLYIFHLIIIMQRNEFCMAHYFIHDYVFVFIIKCSIFMLVCGLPVILLHYYCIIILNK